jgi:rubrerythrin
MKRLFSLLMGAALLLAVQGVWADDMGKMEGMSTPAAGSAPAMKHKAKKVKKKAAPKKKTAVAKSYVCPMDGFTSDKPGKCPKCGMDLVEKK